MKGETIQNGILAQIFQKSMIIVERSPVSYCYNIAMHKQHTLQCSRSCSDHMGFRKRSVFVETQNSDVGLFIHS